MNADGFLNINKPEGKSSYSVVAWLRKMTHEMRIGHAGTLDPIATGVLPICFGQATRVVQFLTNASKTYLAQIEIGTATDTFDREGNITQKGDASGVTRTLIEKALASFRGSIEQMPPVYSALKQRGKRCYELARKGIPVELKPRRVEIRSLELIEYQPPLVTVKVECGKGTYIRSLAHDFGQQLGCGAHLKNLVRLRCGPFYIDDALSLTQIEDAIQQGNWKSLLYPVDSPLLDWKAVIVDKRNEIAIRNGMPLTLIEGHLASEKYCRAYSLDGLFIAVLRFIPEKKVWHPEKVFAPLALTCP